MDEQQKPSNDPQATEQPVEGEQTQVPTPVKRTPEEEAERLRIGQEAFIRLCIEMGREARALMEGRVTKH